MLSMLQALKNLGITEEGKRLGARKEGMNTNAGSNFIYASAIPYTRIEIRVYN